MPPELQDGFNLGKDAAHLKADGYLRNWHLSPVLTEAIKQFRSD